jgi:hypothetical protein
VPRSYCQTEQWVTRLATVTNSVTSRRRGTQRRKSTPIADMFSPVVSG